MRKLIPPLTVIFVSCFIVSFIFAQESSKQLSETQKLKADIFVLKAQLSQCTTQLNNFNLTDEQQKLLVDFRKTMGVDSSAEFDWQTKTFKVEVKDK